MLRTQLVGDGRPYIFLVPVSLMCRWDPADLELAAQCPRWGFRKGKKMKQIGINHTQEGISHGRQPAGQVEGEQ
jgi:hypothetical protein